MRNQTSQYSNEMGSGGKACPRRDMHIWMLKIPERIKGWRRNGTNEGRPWQSGGGGRADEDGVTITTIWTSKGAKEEGMAPEMSIITFLSALWHRKLCPYNYSSSLNRRRASGRSSGREPLTVKDEYGNILQNMRPRAKSVAAVTHPKEVQELIQRRTQVCSCSKNRSWWSVHPWIAGQWLLLLYAKGVPVPNGATTPSFNLPYDPAATISTTANATWNGRWPQSWSCLCRIQSSINASNKCLHSDHRQQDYPSILTQPASSITTATTTTSTATSTDDDMVNLCPNKEWNSWEGKSIQIGSFEKVIPTFRKYEIQDTTSSTSDGGTNHWRAWRGGGKDSCEKNCSHLSRNESKITIDDSRNNSNNHLMDMLMDKQWTPGSTTVAQMHHQQQQQQQQQGIHPGMRQNPGIGQTQVIQSQQDMALMSESDKYGHYMNLKQIQELKQEFAARMKLQQQQVQNAAAMYQTMGNVSNRPLPSLMGGGGGTVPIGMNPQSIVPPVPVGRPPLNQPQTQVHLRSMSQPGLPKIPRPVSNYYEYEAMNPTAIYEQRFIQHQQMMQQQHQAAVQRVQRAAGQVSHGQLMPQSMVNHTSNSMMPQMQQQQQSMVPLQQQSSMVQMRQQAVNQIIHDGNGGHYGVIAGPNGPMAVPVTLTSKSNLPGTNAGVIDTNNGQANMFRRQLSNHRVAPLNSGPMPIMMNTGGNQIPTTSSGSSSSSSGLVPSSQSGTVSAFNPMAPNVLQSNQIMNHMKQPQSSLFQQNGIQLNPIQQMQIQQQNTSTAAATTTTGLPIGKRLRFIPIQVPAAPIIMVQVTITRLDPMSETFHIIIWFISNCRLRRKKKGNKRNVWYNGETERGKCVPGEIVTVIRIEERISKKDLAIWRKGNEIEIRSWIKKGTPFVINEEKKKKEGRNLNHLIANPVWFRFSLSGNRDLILHVPPLWIWFDPLQLQTFTASCFSSFLFLLSLIGINFLPFLFFSFTWQRKEKEEKERNERGEMRMLKDETCPWKLDWLN